MDFVNKLGYRAGLVPPGDVTAQKRCYSYLQKATELIKQRAQDLPKVEVEPGVPYGDDEGTLLKNQIRVFQNVLNIVEASEGKYNWKKARMFWEYWDKVKEDAVKVVEGSDFDHHLFIAKVDELQLGRYNP